MVIPKPMRDRLGIAPGDMVQFEIYGGAVRVEAVRRSASLRGRFAALKLTECLETDRRRERLR